MTKIILYGLFGLLLSYMMVMWCWAVRAAFFDSVTAFRIVQGIISAFVLAVIATIAYGKFFRGIIASIAIIMIGLVSQVGGVVGACIVAFSVMVRVARATPDVSGTPGFCAAIAGLIEGASSAVLRSACGSNEKLILNFLKIIMPGLSVPFGVIIGTLLRKLFLAYYS